MTQKELLYIEDAVGHECTIIKILEDTINNITDEALVSFLQTEEEKHQNTKQNLMNLLEECANE